ncbi:MAG: hypothetical protein LBL50_01725, partial [Candidatus Margulisbacteria bacterium]|nr:hypothetical protein [Candidatus Margulisiibacteriota bacterium]
MYKPVKNGYLSVGGISKMRILLCSFTLNPALSTILSTADYQKASRLAERGDDKSIAALNSFLSEKD